MAAPATASSESVPRSGRRTFLAAEKLRILDEADRTAAPGGIDALLRREGRYSSALTDWRHQRDAGVLFFTHHAHLCDLARRVVGAEILSEQALA